MNAEGLEPVTAALSMLYRTKACTKESFHVSYGGRSEANDDLGWRHCEPAPGPLADGRDAKSGPLHLRKRRPMRSACTANARDEPSLREDGLQYLTLAVSVPARASILVDSEPAARLCRLQPATLRKSGARNQAREIKSPRRSEAVPLLVRFSRRRPPCANVK